MYVQTSKKSKDPHTKTLLEVDACVRGGLKGGVFIDVHEIGSTTREIVVSRLHSTSPTLEIESMKTSQYIIMLLRKLCPTKNQYTAIEQDTTTM